MIEMMILAMIASMVLKRGVEDVIHTAKGGTPPRYAAASARRKSGAASRYWGQLWDDAWGDLSKRHAEKRAKRDIHAPRPDRDPSKMRTVLATAGDDVGRWARATWRHGWDKLDRKQQARRLRDRPGQQTVPGKVVPNAPSRPEDEDRPRPEPRVVRDEDGRTDLRFGEDEDDPTDPTDQQQETAIKDCRNCDGYPHITMNSLRHEWDEFCIAPDILIPDDESGPDSGPDNQTTSPLASTTTQEGTTMTTTIPTGTEVVGLDPAIDYCATTVQACTAMQHSLDHTEAAVIAGGVTGVATAAFAQAKELFGQIARVMEGAGQEFVAYKAGQEFYDANPGAGTKEWLTAGR